MSPPDPRRDRSRPLLTFLAFVAFVAMLAGGTVLVVSAVNDSGGPSSSSPPSSSATPAPTGPTGPSPAAGTPAPSEVHVDGADSDTQADQTVTLNPKAQDQYERAAAVGELAHPLKSPGDVPKPIPGPLAAQDWPGCSTAFVRNKSYRTSSIKGITVHYTVSADTPGDGDNNALTALANNPVSGVSWHFQIGRKDGICTYNVPISMKAWHAAGMNSSTVGIEVHATGKESSYVEGAGKVGLIKLIKRVEQRAGVANQVGQGYCMGLVFVITRPGLFRHVDGGQCSGGHFDTNPFHDPRAMLIAGVARLERKPITKRDRAACQRAYRFHQRGSKAHTAQGIKRQKARYARLHTLRLGCRGGRVVRL